MTREQIIARLRHHLSDIAGEEADEVETDADFRDELDVDSMDFLQIVRAIHEEFHVAIPEVDYGKLETLDAFARYVSERL